jgi:signal transduction histidine kinase
MTIPDPKEVTGAIYRVNHLGAASERLFSRLYRAFGRKQQQEGERTRKMLESNLRLHSALRKREVEIDRLTGILATIDEGVIMQDNEGRLVLINEAARKLLGSIKSFWDSELGTLFNDFRNVTALDSELSPLSAPTRVQVNNRIIGAQLAAVGDNAGLRLGTIIVLRDVTREALAERLKDHFATAISHELRTPMAVIKGMSEVIQTQAEQGKAANRRLLETLSRNVDILDRMIVELLDISELTAGTFSIRNDLTNLEELVWSVINGMMPEAKRAGLDISVSTRNASQLQVRGDDQRLRWALGHLIQNSIFYTEPGGHVLVTASPSDGDRVAVQVVDTGVGISDDDMPHIFERFYRGKPRTRAGRLLDPRGLGQGLFIARRVAEAHGGYLTGSSSGDQGSIFRLVLPRA